MKNERDKKKAISKVAWYKPFDTVVFCPPTPGSKLAKELRCVAKEIREKQPMNIKVVERAGISLAKKLPGLQEEEECQNKKENCIIHKHGGKGNCRASGVVYRGECIACKTRGPTSVLTKEGCFRMIPKQDRKPGTTSVYIGESGRSAFVRGKEHLNALEDPENNMSNAFCKHIRENHKRDNESIDFKVDIIGIYKKPLERQISEGVEIYRAKPYILMNSKCDHYQPAVGRVVITNSIK